MQTLYDIVSQELQLSAEKETTLSLPVNLTNATETPMLKALKLRMEANEIQHVQDVAKHATDLLAESNIQRKQLIERAQELRRQAKECIVKAEDLFNAESTLVYESRIAPLAFLMDVVQYSQKVTIGKLLADKPLVNYWKQSKDASKKEDK